MDRHAAAEVLGVDPADDPSTVRAAYRRLLHRHHPDHAGVDPTVGGPGRHGAAHDATARIIEAYAVLLGEPEHPSPESGPSARRAPADAGAHDGDGWRLAVDGDTITLGIPADEAFLALVDAAHHIGDVTYVDPDAGLLEAVVGIVGGPVCSLVLSLQGRAEGTDAWCTIESLDARRPPPIDDVVRLLASHVDRRPPGR